MRTSVIEGINYHGLRAATYELNKAWKTSQSEGRLRKLEAFQMPPIIPRGDPNSPGWEEKVQKFLQDQQERKAMAKSVMANMIKAHHPTPLDLAKAGGVSSSLGLNFYDLRGPVRMLFPHNTPMRNQIPRPSRVNDGVGVAATWKANRNVGSTYGGASEGNRVGRSTPDAIDYMAKYKEQGVERGVTFTAQFAGEGYADHLADEHIRGLLSLQLQEEGMIWHGNSGNTSGGTGYRLGTAATPTGAVATTRSAGSAGNLGAIAGADLPYAAALTTSSYVSCAVVFLTAMGNPRNSQYGYGNPPSIANGLTPTSRRQNIDGSADTIAGGTSKISALSAVTQATTGNLCVKFTVAASSIPKGTFGYAWYVDVETSNTGTLGSAKLAGITTTPYCYVSGTPTGTQPGTAVGLDTDNSYNSLDFDGLLAYSAVTAGATWLDMGGATLTSQKNGRITEFETILQSIYDQYQAGVDEIWCDTIAAECIDQAVRYSGASATGYQVVMRRDEQDNLLGGFVVSGYKSRFATNSPTGANVLPIRIHPMMPAGTCYFNLTQLPYPTTRAPYVAGMLVQRDYYSIEWPQVSREWPFGTYVHEVLAHEMPWIPAVITGIGAFSAPA